MFGSQLVGLYKTLFGKKVANHIYFIRASLSEMAQITWQTSSALGSKEHTSVEKVQRSGKNTFQADNWLDPLYKNCQK